MKPADLKTNPNKLRDISEWSEDLGPTLWWTPTLDEAPWAGTPHSDGWPETHTRWTCIQLPDDHLRHMNGQEEEEDGGETPKAQLAEVGRKVVRATGGVVTVECYEADFMNDWLLGVGMCRDALLAAGLIAVIPDFDYLEEPQDTGDPEKPRTMFRLTVKSEGGAC